MRAKLSGELIELFSSYIEDHLGLYFPGGRAEDLERALRRASAELGFHDPESCVRSFLHSPICRAHIEVLASHLTVGETYFFRDRKSFEILKEQILPDLIQSRRLNGRNLRIWSAGCATGEEPYSIAILLHSMLPDYGQWNISILGTDINPSFLAKASRAIYREWSFRDVPSWVKEGFFRKTGDHFELLPRVRKGVSFFYHNLAEDAYPCLANNTNAMDIIFCRNVLMYFTEAGKKKVMGKFYQCLLEGGSLVVSPAETSLQYLPRLEALFPGSTIYRKGSVKCEDAARGEETMHDTANYGLQPAADEDFLLPHVAPAPLPVAEPDSYAEALELYERGSYAGAEKKAALLIRDKDDGPALILLSRICANQGRLADALDFCERAIAAEKLNHEYYYLLATILLELGREDEAEVSLGRALYLNQDFALAHFALGNLARRTGMKKKSSRHFENALSVLRRYRPRDIVPGSEGITAGRMIEVISRTVLEGTLA